MSLKIIETGGDDRAPACAKEYLMALRDQPALVKQQIHRSDRRILACHRSNELSQRLEEIPGGGQLLTIRRLPSGWRQAVP